MNAWYCSCRSYPNELRPNSARLDPLLQLLKVDWQLDPIRHEPQFKAIVAQLNFPP
jgi:hypothetical protein